jgi:hypothetical protein
MGGGGSSTYFPTGPTRLQKLIKLTREDTDQKALEGEVNDYLQQLLLRMNQRRPEQIQEYIDELTAVLGEKHEVEKFLFGGSVAKHTFVDGISDIDALVILDGKDVVGTSPSEVLQSFLSLLRGGLTRDQVAEIARGNLAVTVTYRDEATTQIQLLPAIRYGRNVAISTASGTEWKSINPKAFHRELTKANERMNGALVPAIKIAKSILSNLSDEIRPSGYHVESLSLEVTKGYRGPQTIKSLLLHILTASSSRVLQPIVDITSQSRHVDGYLGKRSSDQRVRLSQALAGIARRMNAASTVDRWKEILEE